MQVRIGILLCIGFYCADAQHKKDSTKYAMHYFGTVQSGVQIGCSNCTTGNQLTVSAYLINGVQLTKSFAAGLGIGADSYREWKTLPLFIQLSQKLLGNKNRLVLQLNGGYAWAWYDRQEYPMPNFKQNGGLMIHPALTYQIGIENWNVQLSAGYKHQTTSTSTRYDYQSVGGIAFSETNVTNEFNRLVFQIGFGWR